MKNVKWALPFFLILLVLSIVPTHASSISFEGKVEGFSIEPEGDDLFENFKNVMPGDERAQTIFIRNNSNQKVRLYLQAKEPSQQQRDFLSYFQLNVVQGTKELSNSTAESLDGLKDRVLLGTFNKGQSTDLLVTLLASVELPNEYQNYEGIVNWVFIVEIDDEKPKLPDTGIRNDHPYYWIPLILGFALVTKEVVYKKKGYKSGPH
ncbi:MAG: hypothetical protein GX778_03350 [Erysipelothrix sp.]|nr:hypothetical protein [Erysipelothrix sp.]